MWSLSMYDLPKQLIIVKDIAINDLMEMLLQLLSFGNLKQI